MKYITYVAIFFIFIGCSLDPKEARDKINLCTKYKFGYMEQQSLLYTGISDIDCCTRDTHIKCNKNNL